MTETHTKYGVTLLKAGDAVYQLHTPSGPKRGVVVKVDGSLMRERRDVTVRYDGDPLDYRVWSRSLTKATDYRPADSVAPACYWPKNDGDDK